MAGGAAFFPEFPQFQPITQNLSGDQFVVDNNYGGNSLSPNEAGGALGMPPRHRVQPVTQVLPPQPPG